jgi:hypothetical protein
VFYKQSLKVLSYIHFNCELLVFDSSVFKLGWWEQGSTIRNNVIISVSAAEGLSGSEMLAPAGIYTFSPTNVMEVRALVLPGESKLIAHKDLFQQFTGTSDIWFQLLNLILEFVSNFFMILCQVGNLTVVLRSPIKAL